KKQRLLFAENLSADWWTMFGSEKLNALIQQGFAENPSLGKAQAAIRHAEETFYAARGGILFPAIDGAASFTRQKTSASAMPGMPGMLYNLYGASVHVSYTLDIFGGGRRKMESLLARIEYQQFQYEAAYMILAANIVTMAIQEAALREQIEISHEIIERLEKQLQLVRRQFDLGAVPFTAVLNQQTELALAKAALPALEKGLSLTRHALYALLGKTPGEGNLPVFSLDELALPEELPVSLPSDLARQRPDVRAAEALLHQACAEVGVATANLYPQFTLSGSYGHQSQTAANLFDGPTVVWNIGAGLLQPIFHGGSLTAARRAAIAAYDEAAANYRQTVLSAFQNVADALRSLEADTHTLRAQTEAVAAAKNALDIAEKQFQLGAVSYLDILTAQRNYKATRLVLIEAQALRYADTAALFLSLGGGWWNKANTGQEDTKQENTEQENREQENNEPPE
ncbi:MAG: efflux transporter outer membrane subunit, partial [Syntrophobacterales bacterium]|nr:efflux transporter outer membrane subunit [Syntrophobacterales bacterium]